MKHLALLFLLPLAACNFGGNGPHPQPIITYPEGLFQCMSKPDARNVHTDADLAVLIAKLEASRDDCAAKLKTAGELLVGQHGAGGK